MNAVLALLNALAATYGSHLVCAGQWLIGTALIVVPLASVFALAVKNHAGIKQAGYFLNAVLVVIGLVYTVYILNVLSRMEAAEGAGAMDFLREIWLSLWLLVLPACTGWLLWTHEHRLRASRRE